MSARGILYVSVGLAVLLLQPAPSSAQWVDFSTTSLPPGPGCDASIQLNDGTPVVGTNWVAQLYYGASASSLVAHPAPPVKFRASTTTLPGTFLGGGRELFGLSIGSVAVLTIRVWPIVLAATYEEAEAAGIPTYDSGPFYYQVKPVDPGLSPTNYSMLGFCERNALARLGGTCTGTAFPALLNQLQSQTVARGADITLTAIVTNACLGHWRFNGNFIDPGAIDVPGWRDGSNYLYHSLVLANVQASHAGSYQFIAENYAGSVTSQVAVITVVTPAQLALSRYDNGAFAFHVSEETGRAVVIETAPDLNPATPWAPVFTNTAPFSFTNSTPADRQRFYRTVVP